MLLVRDGAAREIEPPGYKLPLWAQDDGAYEDIKVELRPGDAVVFSSHWAQHAAAAEEVAAGIWSDLTAWCGDESHHDNMTLLVLCVPNL